MVFVFTLTPRASLASALISIMVICVMAMTAKNYNIVECLAATIGICFMVYIQGSILGIA